MQCHINNCILGSYFACANYILGLRVRNLFHLVHHIYLVHVLFGLSVLLSRKIGSSSINSIQGISSLLPVKQDILLAKVQCFFTSSILSAVTSTVDGRLFSNSSNLVRSFVIALD